MWHWQGQIYPPGKSTPTRVPQLSCCTRKDFTQINNWNRSDCILCLQRRGIPQANKLQKWGMCDGRQQAQLWCVLSPCRAGGMPWTCNLTDLTGHTPQDLLYSWPIIFDHLACYFLAFSLLILLLFSACIFVLQDLIPWGWLGSDPWYVSTNKASCHEDLCTLQQNSSWSQNLIRAFKTWPRIKHKTYVQHCQDVLKSIWGLKKPGSLTVLS